MRRALIGGMFIAVAVAATAQAAPPARLTADVRTQGPPVPSSFAGFSNEYSHAFLDLGRFGAVNTVLVQLYKNLAASGGGAPVLRIGGGSQDASWWNPDRRPQPPGIAHDIHPFDLFHLEQFLTAARARAIIGLNLGANDPQIAVDVVRAVSAALPPGQIQGYEIGNEAGYYSVRPDHNDADGRTVFTRPKSYSNADYLRELGTYIAALRRFSPQLPLAAGAFSHLDVPALMRRHGARLSIFAMHNYAMTGCPPEPGGPVYAKPRPDILLQQDVVNGAATAMYRETSVARRAGVLPRLTETNSVACGGTAGTSDTFAAALWGADWMFSAAAIGMGGVNFHNSSPLYQAFGTRLTAAGWSADVRPLYYGMLLFAEATPHRARLLPTTYYAPEPVRTAGGAANLKVWGTVDKHDDVVRVVVINKGSRPARMPIDIRVPFARGQGRLKRLKAPSVTATAGVTWGGQRIETPTVDGRLTGTQRQERVRRGRGSRYRFIVPSGSAALLTVPVSRTRASRYLPV